MRTVRWALILAVVLLGGGQAAQAQMSWTSPNGYVYVAPSTYAAPPIYGPPSPYADNMDWPFGTMYGYGVPYSYSTSYRYGFPLWAGSTYRHGYYPGPFVYRYGSGW